MSPEKCAFLIGFNVTANAKIRSLQGPQLTVCWLTPFKSSPPTIGPTHTQGIVDAPDNCDISTNMKNFYNSLPMDIDQLEQRTTNEDRVIDSRL